MKKEDMVQATGEQAATAIGHPGRCDCMTRVNDDLKGKNTRLATSFILTRDLDGMDCLPLLAVEKVDTSKRGKPISVIPTFCPFCGARYPRNGAEAKFSPVPG